MKSAKLFLKSRATNLTLIALALAAVTTGTLVPQSFLAKPQEMALWRAAHPGLCAWTAPLGLHHLYTSPGFAAILGLIILSLTLSTLEQTRAALRRTFGPFTAGAGVAEFSSGLSPAVARRRLRALGYLPVAGGEPLRLVCHPWGYWGSTLLHLGMLVTITASLFLALTQQRGMLELAEGETHQPSQPFLASEHGILAGEMVLDEAVRLDKVSYQFWPSFALKDLSSRVSYLVPGGDWQAGSIKVNTVTSRGGLSIYQGTRFGHAFNVEMTAPDGRRQINQLLMEHPDKPQEPSYNEFPELMGPGSVLRTKYFADAGQRSFGPGNPLLALRVDLGGREIGRLQLRSGESGSIGGYRFRLLGYSPWSQVIFVRVTGISAVFGGFFLLLLGGLLHYFTPPREALLVATPAGCRVSWQATRFAGFYAEEPQQLAEALDPEKTS
jgi:cytochrome c biogenesis protein